MAIVRFQTAFLAAILLPLACGFVSQSRSRAFERNVLSVAVNGDKADSSSKHSTKDESVSFAHADIATRTRPDFEILSRTVGEKEVPLVYLDSAATSQKPDQVLQILNDYYNQLNSNVHRGAHTLSREATAAYEGARDKIASFINANSRSEIIFTSGATQAINLVASSYGRSKLTDNDEVLLTSTEHHSNLVPWQMLADEKNLKLKFVKMDRDSGGLDLQQFESLLTPQTKVVGFQHVSNVLGCINPVQEMVKLVREKSPQAVILLDACQSVPHMPVDVQDLGVDFMAASGHKMCGPTGIGFLWGKLDLLNSMPPYQGGGEMIDHVSLEGSTWQQAPGRFEAGTPAIAQAIGLGAAVDYLQSIGMDKIEAYEHEIGDYLYERLSTIPGITIFGPKHHRAALCAFHHESVHPSDLSAFLDMEGVAIRSGHHCCQPLHTELGFSHSSRASLYFYNTKEDVDSFITHLQETIAFFENLEASPEDSVSDDDFVPFV